MLPCCPAPVKSPGSALAGPRCGGAPLFWAGVRSSASSVVSASPPFTIVGRESGVAVGRRGCVAPRARVGACCARERPAQRRRSHSTGPQRPSATGVTGGRRVGIVAAHKIGVDFAISAAVSWSRYRISGFQNVADRFAPRMLSLFSVGVITNHPVSRSTGPVRR